MNKRSKLIVCGIAVIAVLCMALPVLFHGTSNECKITGVSAADSRNHSVDTYTVEQDKKKCSVSFTDTAVIDTAFTAEVSTDEPYIIELTVRDSQLPEYREIKDENVAMNTAQTAVKYNADDSVMKRVVYPQNRQLHFSVTTQYKENVSGFIGYSSIKVIPVSKSKEYKLVTSPDKTVEFIIKADDFSKEETDKLSAWSEDLQLYRQQLYQLTGERQPYDGKTIFDFTEQIDYYGLAGNPIFMNSSNLTKDLSTDKSVCIWKYIHEMSHTFDGIEGSYIGNTWNFDSELFANLKMLYVMENNGLSFQESSEKGADAYLKYSASFPHNAFIPVGLCLRSHTIAYFLFIGNRHHLPSSFIGAISRNSFSVITGTPSFAAVLFLDDVEWLSLLIRYDVFPVTEPVTLPPSCSMRSFN